MVSRWWAWALRRNHHVEATYSSESAAFRGTTFTFTSPKYIPAKDLRLLLVLLPTHTTLTPYHFVGGLMPCMAHHRSFGLQ